MTDFIHALELGFGIVLVIAVVVLIIWGLAALDKLEKAMPKVAKVVSTVVLGIVVVGVLFVAVLMIIFPISPPSSTLPASSANHVAQSPPPPPPNYGFDRYDEWSAAKHFIQAQYPGAQTFSGSDDSTIQASTDGTCIVAISVGGVNAFNAPLRDTLTVIMKFQGGRFGLQRIDSQNEAAQVRQQIKDGY
jgi:hypothetical protein